jgi:adenylate kinase family enzyme
MRIAILGNSGSGKSTPGLWLAHRGGARLLDLDTLAWEGGGEADLRSADAAAREVHAFGAANESWVLEGCYANLVGGALRFSRDSLFLDPGEQQCVSNCRSPACEPL